MAFFSNATEFGIWQQDNCEKCMHELERCPVLKLHSIYADPNRDSIAYQMLEVLVPTDKLDGFPAQCSMLLERKTQ